MLSRVVVEHYFEQAIALARPPAARNHRSGRRRRSSPITSSTSPPPSSRRSANGRGALLDPYLERNEDAAARPDGARPVTYIQLGFPLDEE